MRDLSTLSGPWKGFWIQGRVRGTMSLTLFFGDKTVHGGGCDRDGAFDIRGTFCRETGEVRLIKRYALLWVVYDGIWDDPMIHGGSVIGVGMDVEDAGEFEIWPEREEEGIERLASTEELTEPIVPIAQLRAPSPFAEQRERGLGVRVPEVSRSAQAWPKQTISRTLTPNPFSLCSANGEGAPESSPLRV